MLKSKKAFTLIELLVVIAIIGILATISVIAFQNARAKARDAKRIGDVKQVQTALELFFNDNNRYPSSDEWNTGKIFSTTTAGTSTYMQIIPAAPTPADGTCNDNQNAISYIPTANGASYSVSLCLGNTTGSLTSGPKCLTPSGIVDVDCSVPAIGETAPFVCGQNFVDPRDAQSYLTINLNGQCWFGRNLAYLPSVVPSATGSGIDPYYYVNGYQGSDVAVAKSQTSYATYGVLYNHPAALIACPSGWHLPSDAEWNTLNQYFNTTTCDPSRVGYGCTPAGTRIRLYGNSGFDMILSGYRSDSGSFTSPGAWSGLWSATITGANAWLHSTNAASTAVSRDPIVRVGGFSVRCLKD